MVLGTLGLAFLAVVVTPVWAWTKHLYTVVHEGGHAVVALATLHWVESVKIESRGTGETVRASGSAVSGVPFLAAGYTAPSAVGLILARVVERGWSPLNTLLAGVVIMIALLLFIRNLFGVIAVATIGGLLAIFVYLAGPQSQTGAVVAFAWFLLFAGLQEALRLFAVRRSNKENDADNLRKLTGIPADLWVLAFVAFAVFALYTGGRLLLR
jgi:Peptidase M50B-like